MSAPLADHQEQHEADVLLTYLQQHHPGFVAEVLDLADQVSAPLTDDQVTP